MPRGWGGVPRARRVMPRARDVKPRGRDVMPRGRDGVPSGRRVVLRCWDVVPRASYGVARAAEFTFPCANPPKTKPDRLQLHFLPESEYNFPA